jgi:chromatin remodeling complex protein RSC6
MQVLRMLVSQVVKKIWEYIKAHDLQNPKDKRKIIPDEVLGTILTAPVNMMSMNSQLNKHCFTKGDSLQDDFVLVCCSWMAEQFCALRGHAVVMWN